MVIFRGRRSTRAKIVRLDSRKKKYYIIIFRGLQPLDLHFFLFFFSQSKVGFRGKCSTL